MGEILTSYRNIEVPASSEAYLLVEHLRRLGVSVGAAVNSGVGDAKTYADQRDQSYDTAAKAYVSANASEFAFRGLGIGANVDLDTYITPGMYFQPSNANATTAMHYPPNSKAGGLMVIPWGYNNSANRIQIYFQQSRDTFSIRRYVSGAWTAWEEFIGSTQIKANLDAAISGANTAAQGYANTAQSNAQTFASNEVQEAITQAASIWEAADAQTLADAKTYTDVSFAATGPGGASDDQVDAAVERAVLAGRVAAADAVVAKGELVYNVMDYGTEKNRATIEAAIAAVPAGATLYFPSGVYEGDGQSPVNNPGAYLEITKPLTLRGEHGTVFKNLLVYWHGTADAPVPLSAAMVRGEKDIPVTAHGWAPGDYVQLLSEFDVYTTDAGDLQMGSANPTTGSTPTCRATEIHRLMSVTANSARSYDMARYRYGTSTAGLTSPMSGVTTSEARRINMVDGIRVEGITFDNTTATSRRGWVMRRCANVLFVDCAWWSGSDFGGFFMCTEVYNLRFVRPVTYRRLTTASGASHNTFLIGGGTTNARFIDPVMHREAQGIDFMPNNLDDASTPGGPDTALRCIYTTVQDMAVVGGEFYDCSDATTTHPATHGFLFAGNRAYGGSTGVRCRSRRGNIHGNVLHTSRRGAELSSFVDDTMVWDNDFRHTPSPDEAGPWVGVTYSPTSSEVVTANTVKRLDITHNRFHCIIGGGTGQLGVLISHSAPAGYTVPVASKIGLSEITVSGNRFHGCSIRAAAWISGVSVLGNVFSGGSDNTHYVFSNPDSTRTTVSGNTFLDALAGGISLGNKFMGEFPAGSENVIGPHTWIKGAATIVAGNNSVSAMVTQGIPA